MYQWNFEVALLGRFQRQKIVLNVLKLQKKLSLNFEFFTFLNICHSSRFFLSLLTNKTF